MATLADQKVAIAAQKAAHAAVKNGNSVVPAAEDGPLSIYTRAQTLDYIAQLTVCARDGAHLPNVGAVGLLIDPGTPRFELTKDDLDSYVELIAKLTVDGDYTKAEIAEAVERLDANIAAGVSLDPATAENV
jgi:hypothetical protein